MCALEWRCEKGAPPWPSIRGLRYQSVYVGMLNKSLHGERDAPQIWSADVKAALEELDLYTRELVPAVHHHRIERMFIVVYVVDFFGVWYRATVGLGVAHCCLKSAGINRTVLGNPECNSSQMSTKEIPNTQNFL